MADEAGADSATGLGKEVLEWVEAYKSDGTRALDVEYAGAGDCGSVAVRVRPSHVPTTAPFATVALKNQEDDDGKSVVTLTCDEGEAFARFYDDAIAYVFGDRPRTVGELLDFVVREFQGPLSRALHDLSTGAGAAGAADSEMSSHGHASGDEESGGGSSLGSDGESGSYYGDGAQYSSEDHEYSSDDEGVGITLPDNAPGLFRGVSYEVKDPDDLAEHIRTMMTDVAAEHALPVATAGLLLRSVGWDKNALSARLRETDDTAKLFKEVGVMRTPVMSRAEGDASWDGTDTECEICYDEFGPSQVFALPCDHYFCKTCWADHLTHLLHEEGPAAALDAKCPSDGCTMAVGEDVYQKFATPADVSLYTRMLINNMVSDSDSLTWCPRGCGHVIAHSKTKATVRCVCGHTFCFRCSEDPHAPASCAQRKAWLAALDKRKGVTEAKSASAGNFKPCPNPKCNAPTEKTDGCMFLNCKMCNVFWCWQCGQFNEDKSQVHHVWKCNEPPSDGWLSAADGMFDDDGKFLFYWYKNHLDARNVAMEQRRLAAERQEELVERGELRSATDFLIKAANTICDARLVCAWTYPYCYTLEDDVQRNLLQHQQCRFEQFTEDLAELVDKGAKGDLDAVMEGRAVIQVRTTSLYESMKRMMQELGETVEASVDGAAGGAGGAPPEP